MRNNVRRSDQVTKFAASERRPTTTAPGDRPLRGGGGKEKGEKLSGTYCARHELIRRCRRGARRDGSRRREVKRDLTGEGGLG